MSDSDTIKFSKYLVFVDESGDHGLSRIDPNYPMFVLVFCIMTKEDYMTRICPALQNLKFNFWGHDEQVLHEHEIRKPNKEYAFMFDKEKREDFIDKISHCVDDMPFQVIATAIQKEKLNQQYKIPKNPYELPLQFGLERVYRELDSRGEGKHITHVIVEKRGLNEDNQLELAFRRICDPDGIGGIRLPFELVMIPKASNSIGLQIADLIARPIGIRVLRPDQPNRAYEIVEKKFRRSPKGEIKGWGLKVFP